MLHDFPIMKISVKISLKVNLLFTTIVDCTLTNYFGKFIQIGGQRVSLYSEGINIH